MKLKYKRFEENFTLEIDKSYKQDFKLVKLLLLKRLKEVTLKEFMITLHTLVCAH